MKTNGPLFFESFFLELKQKLAEKVCANCFYLGVFLSWGGSPSLEFAPAFSELFFFKNWGGPRAPEQKNKEDVCLPEANLHGFMSALLHNTDAHDFSRQGFCRNPRRLFPNRCLGELSGGFGSGFFWLFSLESKQEDKIHPKIHSKFQIRICDFRRQNPYCNLGRGEKAPTPTLSALLRK